MTNLSVGCLMRCGACRYPENLFALLLFGPPFQPPPRYTNENGYHSILICIPASIDWVGEEFEGISGSNLVPTAPLNTSFRLIFSPPPFFLPNFHLGVSAPFLPHIPISLFSFLFFSFLSYFSASVHLPPASVHLPPACSAKGGVAMAVVSVSFLLPYIPRRLPPLNPRPFYFFIFSIFNF